jgi:hypothetical protein
MREKRIGLIFFTFVLMLSACESGPRVKMAPGFDQTPTPRQAQSNTLGTPAPTRIPPTPTVIPLTLDNKAYTDPSRTLSFYPPQGWDLTTESEGYVKFTRRDGAAWFEGAVESTGYTLSAEDYKKYEENLLSSLYANTEEYRLIEREELLDRSVVSSAFIKAGQQWYAMDFFLQRDRAVYALSFQAHESVWEAYKDRFAQIIDRVRTQTGYLKDNLLYKFRKPYSAPGDGFDLYVPLGWGLTRDQETFPDGVLDMISSPDGEANIDIIALDATERLAGTDIGQASTAILKESIDEDLRTISGDVQDDGRISIMWSVERTGESGSSYFWVRGNVMYILTYRYTSDHAGLYRGLLAEINNTFSMREAEASATEVPT